MSAEVARVLRGLNAPATNRSILLHVLIDSAILASFSVLPKLRICRRLTTDGFTVLREYCP